jgi:PTS system mannose-specific IIC component
VNLFELLPIAMLGALFGLDVVSFPQAMISRPIVAATVGGAFIGHASAGLFAGAALELIALETLPFGASRYPEWGSASVVGGAIFASQPNGRSGALAVAVLASLATAWIGGWTMHVHRQMIALWAKRLRKGLDSGSYRTVVGFQLFGLTMDLGRGLVLTALAMLAFTPIARASLATWSVDPALSRAVVAAMCAVVGGAAAWKLFNTFGGARWIFLGGVIVGLALVAIR